MKVTVLRAFFWEGKPQPVGTVLEVSKPQALELAAANKALPVGDAPLVASGPLTTKTAPELVPGARKAKEKDDAV